MNKELNFKEVPQWWAICLDKTCPLSGNCLRHQGRQLQTGPRPGLNGPASGPRSPGLGLNMRRLATHYTPMPLSNLLVFNRLQLSGISVITYFQILPESAQSRSSPSGSPRLSLTSNHQKVELAKLETTNKNNKTTNKNSELWNFCSELQNDCPRSW